MFTVIISDLNTNNKKKTSVTKKLCNGLCSDAEQSSIKIRNVMKVLVVEEIKWTKNKKRSPQLFLTHQVHTCSFCAADVVGVVASLRLISEDRKCSDKSSKGNGTI